MIELQFNPLIYDFFLAKGALFSMNLKMPRKNAFYQIKNRYFRRNIHIVNDANA